MQVSNTLISEKITENKDTLAEIIVNRHYQVYPELESRYGLPGRQKCLKDAHYHLSYLTEALRDSSPELFSDYIGWAKYMLEGRKIPANDLLENLKIMQESIKSVFSDDLAEVINGYISTGIEKLAGLPAEIPSFIDPGNPLGKEAEEYLDYLVKGERHLASRLVLDRVNSGTPVKDIYLHVFQNVQYEIGRLWQLNQISVAQEHYATASTQLIMSQLYPHIFSMEKNGRTLVATCIEEDLHEIGIRMIADFFEMEGWDTFYLGANTPVNSIISTIIDRKADVVAVSATMSYHVKSVSRLIQSIREDERARRVKVMVGGYPFNIVPELWTQIGADGYAVNAQEAIITAGKLAGYEDW